MFKKHPLKVLFVASEAAPFAEVGGLGSVMYSIVIPFCWAEGLYSLIIYLRICSTFIFCRFAITRPTSMRLISRKFVITPFMRADTCSIVARLYSGFSVQGKRCPIIGRVCMNLTMVEVPRSACANIGSETILIGRQGTHSISADDLASSANTINYEIVTRINAAIPRYIVR